MNEPELPNTVTVDSTVWFHDRQNRARWERALQRISSADYAHCSTTSLRDIAHEALKPLKPDSQRRAADMVQGWIAEQTASMMADDSAALLARLNARVQSYIDNCVGESEFELGGRHACNHFVHFLDEIKKPRKPAKTWQQEHYPVEAETLRDASDEACTEHGLRKWEGARSRNLARYDMMYHLREVIGAEYSLYFGGKSCALCRKYNIELGGRGCPACPVVKAGLLPCDDPESAYHASHNDPEPMIEALRTTLAWLEADHGVLNDMGSDDGAKA